MKKIVFLFTCVTLMAFSCSKSDDEVIVIPPVEYSVQYPLDIKIIEDYLDEYMLNPDITDYATNVNRADLFVKKVSDTDESLLDLLNKPTYPTLLVREVDKKTDHNMSDYYKVYYLQFSPPNSNAKPTPYDLVYAAYRGSGLTSVTTSGVTEVTAYEFEDSSNIDATTSLSRTIDGWKEIFPLFSIGDFNETTTGIGPNKYNNFGAGVMFIPSGLGYYNISTANIPSYSPLVFSFKLNNLKRVDNDGDGIFTVDEIVRNADNTFTLTDTDGDGFPDYGDFDDDNDGFSTKVELKKTDGTYYLYTEIPDCSGNFTSPTRLRRHLDKTCYPPF